MLDNFRMGEIGKALREKREVVSSYKFGDWENKLHRWNWTNWELGIGSFDIFALANWLSLQFYTRGEWSIFLTRFGWICFQGFACWGVGPDGIELQFYFDDKSRSSKSKVIRDRIPRKKHVQKFVRYLVLTKFIIKLQNVRWPSRCAGECIALNSTFGSLLVRAWGVCTICECEIGLVIRGMYTCAETKMRVKQDRWETLLRSVWAVNDRMNWKDATREMVWNGVCHIAAKYCRIGLC